MSKVVEVRSGDREEILGKLQGITRLQTIPGRGYRRASGEGFVVGAEVRVTGGWAREEIRSSKTDLWGRVDSVCGGVGVGIGTSEKETLEKGPVDRVSSPPGT